jgi:hypothetical protein
MNFMARGYLEERKTSPIFLSNKAAAPKYEMLFLLD